MYRDGFALWRRVVWMVISVAVLLEVANRSVIGLELTKVEISTSGVSMPQDLADVSGQLALSATASGLRELHFVGPFLPQDGSTVVQLNTSGQSSFPYGIADVAGLAVLGATDSGDTDLFIVDPMNLAAGGTKVDVNPAGSSNPTGITDVANLALFAATNADDTQLYIVDPTALVPMATEVVVNPAGNSNPNQIADVGGLAVFRATAGNGEEIQITDPSLAVPTVTEVDINPGPGGSTPSLPASDDIVNVAGLAVFAAFDGMDTELYVLDPTGPTSTKVDIGGGIISSYPASIAAVAGQAVFRATDLTSGTELHILDPTNPGAGTIVVDIQESFANSSPADVVDVSSRAVFSADDGSGRELFVVDPLNPGSGAIQIDINPDGASNPQNIVNVDGRAVFSATADGDTELYIVDPLLPEAGFLKVDVYPEGSSSPSQITDVDGRIAFAATDGFGTDLFILSLDATWNRNGSGTWDDGQNWDGGEVPRPLENAVINPPSGVTVQGPNDATYVSNLVVDATNGTSTLSLAAGTILAHNVTIGSGGRLAGTGNLVVDVGRVTNMGIIEMAAGGSINATLENTVTGEIRSNASASVFFAGTGNTNLGEINLLGGSVEFIQDLHNQRAGLDNGLISGRGTLFVNGGLTNDGSMAFSDGTTDIFGDVDNTATGLIINSGNGVVTFFDDVTNNGEIRTSTGSTTVFFGTNSGGGSYTGGGTVHFEGDVSPGNSTAIVQFENDVVFMSNSSLTIELGGTQRGTEYDALDVAGSVELHGDLNVELASLGTSIFQPTAGDTYSIVSAAGGLNDTFRHVNLPPLSADLQWQLDRSASSYILDVVIAGDFNVDGVVNSADYTLWRDSLGQSGSALAADANGDGTISPADYEAWKAHFGWDFVSFAGAAAVVPEPGTLPLLLLAICCQAFGRRSDGQSKVG